VAVEQNPRHCSAELGIAYHTALADLTIIGAMAVEQQEVGNPLIAAGNPNAARHKSDVVGPPLWPYSKKGSNDRPSPTVACATECRLPEFTKPMARASLILPNPLPQKL